MLVAIAIPIFTTQLEKAREATDAANLRSAYAEAMAAALDSDSPTMPTSAATVTQKQTAATWASAPAFPANFEVDPPTASGSWTLTYVKDANGVVTGVKATHS